VGGLTVAAAGAAAAAQGVVESQLFLAVDATVWHGCPALSWSIKQQPIWAWQDELWREIRAGGWQAESDCV
jgi:hypothetical protein